VANAPAAETTYDPDIYKNDVPDFSAVKRTTTWTTY
jgi:hypothetical protein